MTTLRRAIDNALFLIITNSALTAAGLVLGFDMLFGRPTYMILVALCIMLAAIFTFFQTCKAIRSLSELINTALLRTTEGEENDGKSNINQT